MQVDFTDIFPKKKIMESKISQFPHCVNPTFVISAIGCLFLAGSGTACALLPASADMYVAFCILRFIAGAGHVGTFMMSFTLSVEYIGREKQAFCGCLIEIPFASGEYPLPKSGPVSTAQIGSSILWAA